MTEQNRKGLWLFGFFALTLLLLELALSVDYSASLLVILLEIDLFTGLIVWYLVIGIISPHFIQASDPLLVDETEPNRILALPMWFKVLIPILLLLEVLGLMYLVNNALPMGSIVVMTCYILGPFLFLFYHSWITTFLSAIWVWFPIEWNLIDDHLGNLHLSLVPLDALIGIFALLWPLIMHGRHVPWYDWNLTSDNVKLVGKISGILTLIIVPLGILTKFLTINPDNFLDPSIKIGSNPVVNSIFFIILTFYLIFLVQGIMEETLFRDVIFHHQLLWLKDHNAHRFMNRFDFGHLYILLGGLLIISIPFWDNVLGFLASFLPFVKPVVKRLGSLSHPLGESEGRSIPMFESYPLWLFYLMVAVLLMLIAFFIYHRNHDPVFAALLLSAMIFGFAHFEDYRYVFFASVAGFGYGYTYYKSKNLLASAMVHMGVDAVWSLLLSY